MLCDTSAFLRTRPDLNANRMFARRDGQPFQLMLGPYYVQGGVFYSQRYERLFYRLQRDKQVNLRQVADVQASLGRQMIRSYGRGPWLPDRWAARQEGYCSDFAKANGVREPE